MSKQEAQDRAFALIEQAALTGARCPLNSPFGPLDSANTTALARQGRILIEVYTVNWRRVTILTGPHRGKTTADCPKRGAKPYKVVGMNTRTARGFVDAGQSRRQQPSAPRPLTREELG